MEDEVGTDLPLARWYARMKETIELTSITDTAVILATVSDLPGQPTSTSIHFESEGEEQ